MSAANGSLSNTSDSVSSSDCSVGAIDDMSVGDSTGMQPPIVSAAGTATRARGAAAACSVLPEVRCRRRAVIEGAGQRASATQRPGMSAG